MNEMLLTEYQKSLVADDICPRCRAELDTGFECLSCGYDAKWIIEQIEQEKDNA